MQPRLLYSIYKNHQIVEKCVKIRLIYHDFCGIILKKENYVTAEHFL